MHKVDEYLRLKYQRFIFTLKETFELKFSTCGDDSLYTWAILARIGIYN